MRLGLYGGIANNMYVFAQALAAAKWDVTFIRDRSDRYPFSQPVWEDVSTTQPYTELGCKDWEWWSRNEAVWGWQAPPWLTDPFSASPYRSRTDGWRPPWWVRLGARRRPFWHRVLACMRQCDANLVCGVEGELLAWAARRPYVIWPHGADIRLAAGLTAASTVSLSKRPLFLWERRLLRQAFSAAEAVGTHDPTGVGGHFGDPFSRLRLRRVMHIPIPLSIGQPRLPQARRRQLLTQLARQLDVAVPAADCYGFVPSRIDFSWKGHDRLLQALQELPAEHAPHMVFSGWGRDYEAARRLLPANRATFLPFALSKPLLRRFYMAADFVVDQFVLGTYGTAAVEAMNCGAPLVMWLDSAAFQRRGWTPPPVFNVRTSADIRVCIEAIALGATDTEVRAAAGYSWVRQVHGAEPVSRQLAATFGWAAADSPQRQPCAQVGGGQ